ncbi:MAG: YidC/Oxa1 family membrane protein insertase, partial [Clostridia bacterium]|nr:YidC/Oxa1 family membrane protein insertase [Clostridia bacterium]
MDIRIINFAVPQTSGVLVDVIYWLISVSSSIAVGVILFTVILKLITFPFDLYSRISMKKNSILMEEMRPELEKLQKQYANDKTLYSQKMMALYKKNGYSMWGACLPTIVTLVIFIVAISAFSKYSGFQNQKYFYDMSLSYNSAIYEGFADGGDIIYYNSEDKTFVVDKEVLETEVK